MGKEAKNPKEHSTLRVRRTVTPAKLAANRANAKLGGRPPGSMSPISRDLSERCRVKDMRHVEILEDIAENSQPWLAALPVSGAYAAPRKCHSFGASVRS